MRKIGCFFYCTSLVFFLIGAALGDFCLAELGKIDQKLESLEGRQSLLRGRAFQLEEEADRWQFRSEFYMDARRAFTQAEVLKEAADEMQPEIDLLKEQKMEFYEEHPECRTKT